MLNIITNVEPRVEMGIRIEVVSDEVTRDMMAIILGVDLLNESNFDVAILEVPEEYPRLLVHSGDIPLDNIGRGSIQTCRRKIGRKRNMR